VEIAVRSGCKRRLAQIYVVLGGYYSMIHMNFPKATQCLEEALTLSAETNDVISYVLANTHLGLISGFDCQFDAALMYFEKALEINVAANTLWGISALKSNIALVHFLRGSAATACSTSQEALRLARESGDTVFRALAHCRHGLSCYARGLFEEARESLVSAVDLWDRANTLGVDRESPLMFLVLIHLLQGDLSAAQGCLDRMIQQPADIFTNLHKLIPTILLSAHRGHVDGKTLADCVHANRPKCFDGWMSRTIGESLLLTEPAEFPEVERWLRAAIQADETNGMRWDLAMDHAALAKLFDKKGDAPRARETLRKAIDIFNECGADGWVEKYEKELLLLS